MSTTTSEKAAAATGNFIDERIGGAKIVKSYDTPDWSPDNPGLLMLADLGPMLVNGLAK